jgi:nucleotide-binding universal stress UspA family protein
MTFKTILVQAEAAAEPRLQTAAALAKAHGARLIGVGAEMFEPLVMADPYGVAQGAWLAAMREQLEKDLDAAGEAFERCAAGVDHEWRRIVDAPAPTLAHAARAADLIVVGGVKRDRANAYRSADVGELIVTAGRPVLVAPSSGGELVGKRVLVAWKETREARRATLDALPLLERADDVVVVAVVPESQVEAAEFQTGDVMHADLIVAGGYGHNRFTEWLLGGVTKGLLDNPQQFLFFSH